MRQLAGLVLAMLLLVSPAAAEDVDTATFRAVISAQIEAFQADDGQRAYGYASPSIRQIFPTAEIFMDMVRRGYQPVYRPQSLSFGEAGTSADGRPFQKVTILGPDGLTYEALYSFELQPDGSWQISGCALVRAPDLNT
ncbi:DUF4864 domain-containing protein [Aestuariivirga sp.]|jgi:hypothetical protein|uniref:DUF4864 domain-containing protein n=1 Tax=Aestuariivirga sp. TaxID=2650926 RepID=UPI00378340E3